MRIIKVIVMQMIALKRLTVFLIITFLALVMARKDIIWHVSSSNRAQGELKSYKCFLLIYIFLVIISLYKKQNKY